MLEEQFLSQLLLGSLFSLLFWVLFRFEFEYFNRTPWDEFDYHFVRNWVGLNLVVVLISGFLAMLCILVGGYGVSKKSTSQSLIYVLGFKMTTDSVGVVFTGIGLLQFVLVVRQIRPLARRFREVRKKRRESIDEKDEEDRE